MVGCPTVGTAAGVPWPLVATRQQGEHIDIFSEITAASLAPSRHCRWDS